MSAVSTGWGTTTSLSSQYGNAVVPSAAELALAPDRLDPDVFRTWTTAKQLDYVQAKGSGSPRSVTIGPAGTERIKASAVAKPRVDITAPSVGAGAALSVSPSTPSRPATTAELLLKPEQLDPKVFLAWDAKDRDAWLVKNGVKAAGDTLTVGSDTLTQFDSTSGKAELVGRLLVRLSADVAIEGSVLFDAGKAEDIPYLQLDGSSAGMPAAGWRADAERLFPTIDGVTHTLSVAERPTGFYIDPASFQFTQADLTPEADPDKEAARLAVLKEKQAKQESFVTLFSAWPSQYQLEFVKSRGTNGILVIPSLSTPILSVFVSRADPTKLKTAATPAGPADSSAIAKMEKVDQDLLATDAGLTTTLELLIKVRQLTFVSSPAVTNILSTSDPQEKLDAATAAQRLIDYIDAKETSFRGATQLPDVSITANGNDPTTQQDKDNGIYHLFVFHESATADITTNPPTPVPERWVWHKFQVSKEPLPDADRAAFTRQLDLLKEQLGMMGIVSPTAIERKLKELKERFDRAFAFYDVKKPFQELQPMGNPNENAVVYRDVISLDNNATIDRGYQIFISQEKQIAELAESRMQIVRENGSLFGRKMDAAELVYRFQSLYSSQVEAEVIMETEDVNQQNALVKTYSAFQDILNRTLTNFEKAGGDKRVRILGKTVDDLAPSRNKFTEQELLAMSMFEDQTGKGQRHPLEVIGKILRPTNIEIFVQPELPRNKGDNYNLAEQTYMQWNGYYTSLSERVTQINQNLQIKMNDVTSLDKQANRHFDLANSALAKMNEMLNNIARAG